ncbi:MAG: hypothetical protein U0Z17_07435 [Bacteroidales bacterium]
MDARQIFTLTATDDQITGLLRVIYLDRRSPLNLAVRPPLPAMTLVAALTVVAPVFTLTEACSPSVT